MGKRKYDSDKSSPSKKNTEKDDTVGDSNENAEEPSTNEPTDAKPRKVPKTGGFDVKHFRKELASKQGQTMGKFSAL